MMNQKGITIVEMAVVMGIIAIITSMATLGFRSLQNKGRVEGETKKVYADLMAVRTEALTRKTARSLKVAVGNQLTVYGNRTGTGAALRSIPYNDAVTSDDNTAVLAFDEDGVALQPRVYCIGAAGNPSSVDAVVVDTTSVRFGKLSGGACSSANITLR